MTASIRRQDNGNGTAILHLRVFNYDTREIDTLASVVVPVQYLDNDGTYVLECPEAQELAERALGHKVYLIWGGRGWNVHAAGPIGRTYS